MRILDFRFWIEQKPLIKNLKSKIQNAKFVLAQSELLFRIDDVSVDARQGLLRFAP